jgi:hypothetical protein
MPVNIYCHRDTVVPELLLNVGGTVVVHKQDACVGVPEIVRTPKPDFGKPASSLRTPLHHALSDSGENVANLLTLTQNSHML